MAHGRSPTTVPLKDRGSAADERGVTRRVLLSAAVALGALWGAGAAVAASQPPPPPATAPAPVTTPAPAQAPAPVTAPAPVVAPPVTAPTAPALPASGLDAWARPAAKSLVADGSWRQARCLMNRCRGLDVAQRVRLPEGAPTRYRLRSPRSLDAVSTLEAVARALGVLEGPEQEERLERVFDELVTRTLRAPANSLRTA